MNEIMAVIQRAKQEDVQNELQDELAKQVQQVQQLAGEKDLELVSEIPSDVEEKEKLQVPEDISHMQDEISEDKTTESEVLDYETSENETSDVETANTEISEKTSDSENADEAVWFEAYKPEEEPQISEWAAPVAETVEVEPEEEVQEEPEKEPEEEETQEVVQEELEKEPEEAGPQEEIQEESKKDPEEAETQEEIQEEIQEEPEEEEPQEEFEEEPEDLELFHHLGHTLFQIVLHGGIQRQIQGCAGLRLIGGGIPIGHLLAVCRLCGNDSAVYAGQVFVILIFQTVLSVAVTVGKTDDCRRQFILGIIPPCGRLCSHKGELHRSAVPSIPAKRCAGPVPEKIPERDR